MLFKTVIKLILQTEFYDSMKVILYFSEFMEQFMLSCNFVENDQ